MTGAVLKEQALYNVEAKEDYGPWIEAGERALLSAILDSADGTATADDVRRLLGKLPDDLSRAWLGVVPMKLARAKIIECAGFTTSETPTRHTGIVRKWRLLDREAAMDRVGRRREVRSDAAA